MSNFTLEHLWTTQAGLRAACIIARDSHRCGYVEEQTS